MIKHVIFFSGLKPTVGDAGNGSCSTKNNQPPGTMLNWVLAGAPIVSCDTGGDGPKRGQVVLDQRPQKPLCV